MKRSKTDLFTKEIFKNWIWFEYGEVEHKTPTQIAEESATLALNEFINDFDVYISTARKPSLLVDVEQFGCAVCYEIELEKLLTEYVESDVHDDEEEGARRLIEILEQASEKIRAKLP